MAVCLLVRGYTVAALAVLVGERVVLGGLFRERRNGIVVLRCRLVMVVSLVVGAMVEAGVVVLL
jgi:hypothetical protein